MGSAWFCVCGSGVGLALSYDGCSPEYVRDLGGSYTKEPVVETLQLRSQPACA